MKGISYLKRTCKRVNLYCVDDMQTSSSFFNARVEKLRLIAYLFSVISIPSSSLLSSKYSSPETETMVFAVKSHWYLFIANYY